MQPQGQNQSNQGQAQPQQTTNANQQPNPQPMPRPAVNTVSPNQTISPKPATVQPVAQNNTVNNPAQQVAVTPPAPPNPAPTPNIAQQPNMVQPNIVQPTVGAQPEAESASQITATQELQKTDSAPVVNENTNPPARAADQPVPAQPSNAAPEPDNSNIFIRSLVNLQFLSLFVILVGFFPSALFFNTNLMIAGALMMALGAFLAYWAITSFNQKITPSPKPLKHSYLVTGGPYKYMRHPMYSSILLGAIGLTLIYPTITRIVALGVLIFVLFTKMGIEEHLLAKRYHHYPRYQRLTGRIFPKFKKPDINIDIPRF